jgi:glycosyltransferase involved in cell wall biosynthesis
MHSPVVSVIIPSYNHGRFLKSAVESVRSQTLDDIEIIVVDDGSTDGSQQLISDFCDLKDDRLHSIVFGKNLGACTAINVGISAAKGSLIAICNSDDLWQPYKLNMQLNSLMQSPEIGAVFTDVCWIDEERKKIRASALPFVDIFRQRNRSRTEWLRHLIEVGNCLCHPSVLIRRNVYDSCGTYDNRYRQVPDYDMWIRVVEKFQILVLSDQSVNFRLLQNQGNTSSPSPSNSNRSANEIARILRQFFARVNRENFFSAFGTMKMPSDVHFCFALEKALYLLKRQASNDTLFRDIGLGILYEFLNRGDSSEILANYGLPRHMAQILAGISSPWVDGRHSAHLSSTENELLDYISGGAGHFVIPSTPRTELPARVESPAVEEEESLTKESKILRSQFENLIGSISWKSTRPLREIKALVLRKESGLERSDTLKYVVVDEWLQSAIFRIKSSASWKLTQPLRLLHSLMSTITNQLVPIRSSSMDFNPEAETELAIFDETFPEQPGSSRHDQLLQLLIDIPTSLVYTAIRGDCGDNSFVIAVDIFNSKQFGYPRVRIFTEGLKVKSKLAYCTSLKVCEKLLPFFERNELSFVFALDSDHDEEIDSLTHRLTKICGSTQFRGIVTAEATVAQYLQDSMLCARNRIKWSVNQFCATVGK